MHSISLRIHRTVLYVSIMTHYMYKPCLTYPHWCCAIHSIYLPFPTYSVCRTLYINQAVIYVFTQTHFTYPLCRTLCKLWLGKGWMCRRYARACNPPFSSCFSCLTWPSRCTHLHSPSVKVSHTRFNLPSRSTSSINSLWHSYYKHFIWLIVNMYLMMLLLQWWTSPRRCPSLWLELSAPSTLPW